MGYQSTTILVTDTSFAPLGAEVQWDVLHIDGLDTVATIILDKDNETGEITLLFDSAVLPTGIEQLTTCNLTNPVILNGCGFAKLFTTPFITVTAGNAVGDTSGGTAQLAVKDTLHFYSESLNVTVDQGSALVRIEIPAYGGGDLNP